MPDDDKSRDPIPSELVQEDGAFAQRVQSFIDGLQARLTEISRAVDAGDYAALRTLANEMRGSAAGCGIPLIDRHVAELEQHAIQHELDAIQQDLLTLQELVARVVLRS